MTISMGSCRYGFEFCYASGKGAYEAAHELVIDVIENECLILSSMFSPVCFHGQLGGAVQRTTHFGHLNPVSISSMDCVFACTEMDGCSRRADRRD